MIYFLNYFNSYFLITDFVKNFLLKDNIDLWNEMKNSLYYFTIFTSIQTLLFIYYVTFKLPENPKTPDDLPKEQKQDKQELADLILEELPKEDEQELLEELPKIDITPLEIDNILDSLNNLEQRLNIIRTNFEDTSK